MAAARVAVVDARGTGQRTLEAAACIHHRAVFFWVYQAVHAVAELLKGGSKAGPDLPSGQVKGRHIVCQARAAAPPHVQRF